MGIEFNILWFEDDQDWINGTKTKIEKIITDRHFIPKIECFPRAIQLEKLKDLEDQMHTFHLILTDFTLKEDTTGIQVIQLVRDNHILADVLFYSGKSLELHKLIHDNELEGVYTAIRERDPFITKLEKLIDKTIVRFETPSSMRSHLINYVAENDLIIKDFIKDSIDCSQTNKYTYKLLKDSLKDTTDKIEKIIKKCDEKCDKKSHEGCHNYLEYSLDKIGILDSEKLSKLFHKVLKINSSPEIFIHQEYRDNILQIRNEFAHDSHKVCTAGECTTIRKNMIKYKKQISTQIK